MTDGSMDQFAGAPVRINVRPLASPLPLGFFAFGIGMMLLAALSAGWVPVREAPQVGLMLAAFVFPLEGVAAIIAFLARDVLAATALGLFTTSWLALGLSLITAVPGETSHTLGVYLVSFAAAVITLSAVGMAGKPLIGLLLGLSAARAILDGIYEFTGTLSIQHVSGYVAAAIAAVAWYGGTALLMEDLRQRATLPVLRRGASRSAMEGDLDDQLERVRREAGIRQQL